MTPGGTNKFDLQRLMVQCFGGLTATTTTTTNDSQFNNGYVRFTMGDWEPVKSKPKLSKASQHAKLCLETNEWLRETKEALFIGNN